MTGFQKQTAVRRRIRILLPVYNLTTFITMACCPFNTTEFRRHVTIHAKVISIYRQDTQQEMR